MTLNIIENDTKYKLETNCQYQNLSLGVQTNKTAWNGHDKITKYVRLTTQSNFYKKM